MHLSPQQVETLSFFDRVPLQWRERAEGKLPRVNVIAQRNACVRRVRALLPRVESMLDIGCGTGELVLFMAAEGIQAAGIDFAPEMIRVCEQRRLETGAAGASFHCCPVFDYQAAPESADLISALGFIEYISPAELTDLLALARRLLRPGGALALGSRNRLFNLVSLNDYTRLEMSLGAIDALLRESVAFATAPSALEAIADASPPCRMPHPTRQPRSWIDVSIRYQYTPAGLAALAAEAGLQTMAVYPVHYHPMPPPAVDELGSLHRDFSDMIHCRAPENHRLIPFSSSFVLAARKPATDQTGRLGSPL